MAEDESLVISILVSVVFLKDADHLTLTKFFLSHIFEHISLGHFDNLPFLTTLIGPLCKEVIYKRHLIQIYFLKEAQLVKKFTGVT